MLIMDLYTDFLSWLSNWDLWKLLEVAGVIFSIISVVLAYYNKVSLYFFGILSTFIYIFLYAHPSNKLYAEAGLSLYYFIMSIIGWIAWVGNKKNNKPALPITFTTSREWWITLLITLSSFIFIYIILITFTDSNVPIWDASVACFAWAGMWLLTKRKVEYWLVLNISNLIAIPLLAYKGLYPTVGLTLFQFTIAFMGYFKWKKAVTATKQ